MAIHKRLTEEELALLEIIRHPTWLGKFIREYDNDAEWNYSDYQEEMLCDFNSHVSFCCGRSIGKCLHKDCRILNPENGEYLTVEEWYNNTLPKIVSIDDHWKQTVSKPIITPNGIQECLELITVKGFNTKVTLEHPFLTPVGWKEAKDLEVGDFIAIPKALPYFGHHVLPEEDLKILAHFIAEGTYHVGSITTAESEVVSDIFTFANKYKLNIRQENNLNSGKAATYYITKKTGVKNYYLRLLENYGLRNCHSYEKFVPKKIFTLTKNQIAIFLSCLFGDDGWVTDSEIGYATTSERLAKDIHHLLLRFGIIASVGYKNNQYRGCWWLSIKGINNIELFINSINIVGNKKRNLAKRLRDKYKDAFNQNDLLPIPNFHDYKIRIRRGYLDRQGQRKEGFATWPLSYYPTRKKAARIINKDDTFHKFENADIRWVRVKQINEIGQSETYAIEVSPHHTHVVDDIYSHNTVALIDKLVWLCMNKFWDESIVYTVPGRAHLEPVFRRLVNWFRRHPLLRYYTGSRGINSQSFTIKLNNDAVIDCRIAGQSGTGANVVGLHIPVILLDEGGFYPFGTWSELLPCLNTWQEGYQFFVSGVPTGLREKNVLYFADQKDIQFTKHRIPAHRNPRYSEEDEVRNIKQFGGVESEDYIHMVLGEHGAPSYMLFDRSRMRIEDYISFHGSALGSKIKEDPGYLARFYASMPPPKKGVDAFMFGIDLGYCYSEDTDVLTGRGWLQHKDIKLEDTIACFDTNNNEIVWDKPLLIWEQDYNGEMLEIDGKSTNFCVTPEHTVWTSKTNENISQEYGKLKAKELPELKNARFKVKTAAKNKYQYGSETFEIPYYYCDRQDREKKSTIVDMSVWLQFLAWFISEGSATANRNWEINITQSVNRYTNEIDKVLEQLPYTVSKKEFTTQWGNQQINWRITCKELCLWLRKNCGIHSENKKIPDFVFNCSTEDQELFLRTLLLGDGSRVNCNKSPMYTSSSQKLLDQVQRLAISLGYSSTKSFYKKNNIGRVSIMKRTENQLHRDRNIKRINYSGKIYCLKTTTGYYITRRKGKVAIQGNTDPTVILGLYKKQNIWRFLFRAVFRQVPYPKQEEIIDYLDSMYNPGVIGIDEGSAGKSVVQHLMTDAQYKHKRYKDKVVPIQFRAMVPIALDADGEEIKVRAKQFGMQLLQSKVNEQVIAFSWKDEAMINELERTTYTKTPAGEFVYKTITARGGLRHGEDHNVAALLCFALAHYLKEEANMYLTTKRVALYRPRWRTT